MMIKKTGAIFGVLILALLVSGVSVWEGAAAVSLNGELPEEGYYVATRSFPRNTVVDVTNLETGRTIRVIVAAALDAPGLLAVVSRDTARAIGLQSRSIGRVRMTMPSDPIAFSRFGQGVNTGDPDFDPRAALAAAGVSVELPPPLPAETVPVPPAVSGPEHENTDGARPIAPNPPLADLIVDLPPLAGETPAPSAPLHYPEFSAWGWTAEPERPATGRPPEPELPGTGRSFTGIHEQAAPGAAETPSLSAARPEDPWNSSAPERDGGPLYLPGGTVTAPEQPPDSRLTLVPAENRVPAYPFTDLPPEMEVPPITRQGGGEDQPAVIPEDLIIPPVPERGARDASPSALVLEPEVSPIARGNARAGEDGVISGGAIQGNAPYDAAPDVMEAGDEDTAASGSYVAGDSFPGTDEAPFPGNEDASGQLVPAPARFSAPVISELERGKYYLQLGAWREVRRVEEEISRLGSAWPLVIQAGGSGGRAVYRLLLGPVNLGESGALLERFRVRGYRDAFVRHN
ncbi:MAG: SPOR domain-containing protein [Spirochaetaceae bacterium]|nr:SPOR domain-containing protein [Spirochaetaceae bacterium]